MSQIYKNKKLQTRFKFINGTIKWFKKKNGQYVSLVDTLKIYSSENFQEVIYRALYAKLYAIKAQLSTLEKHLSEDFIREVKGYFNNKFKDFKQKQEESYGITDTEE